MKLNDLKTETLDVDTVAKALKELGHPTRLMIFQSVIRAGFQGIAVGGLQKSLNIPGSTLSHHISGLASAGLITQRREGRTLYCVAEFTQLQSVIGFLQDECCVDENQENEQQKGDQQ
ncbi:metalloregulator ArsR/SmtB family transcription factor [Vibrio sp. ZSDE26]|uniref:Metalloregulator ArsR/SmtB family transcription factor n=1 Tax=Vibrio amylolyticus TaxID=2847292 RepID=A0A9X1XP28_9VIBR|nr:metalloregulator ArsR/SmtB family transcription factor [Vibrio amylolyticus]MCK6262944.1 metalloregulator ArsR/SmtB family transcription factor [Vibrio amylolyticus]